MMRSATRVGMGAARPAWGSRIADRTHAQDLGSRIEIPDVLLSHDMTEDARINDVTAKMRT